MFSVGQSDIINSISEEIANAKESMIKTPTEINLITKDKPSTTIEELL